MPTVRIRIFEGRSDEIKDSMAAKVKEVVGEHTGNSVDKVKVIYEEIPRPVPADGKK
jgi:4-oxalocrotonate tautomerase family enzyme